MPCLSIVRPAKQTRKHAQMLALSLRKLPKHNLHQLLRRNDIKPMMYPGGSAFIERLARRLLVFPTLSRRHCNMSVRVSKSTCEASATEGAAAGEAAIQGRSLRWSTDHEDGAAPGLGSPAKDVADVKHQ